MNQIYLQKSQEKKTKTKKTKKNGFPWHAYLFTCKRSHDFLHLSSFMPASSDSERCFDAGALIQSGGSRELRNEVEVRKIGVFPTNQVETIGVHPQKEDSYHHRNLRVHPPNDTPHPTQRNKALFLEMFIKGSWGLLRDSHNIMKKTS